MTYHSGLLFVFDREMNVENLRRVSNADAHAGLVDKVAGGHLGTCGGQLHLRQELTGGGLTNAETANLAFWFAFPIQTNPIKSKMTWKQLCPS